MNLRPSKTRILSDGYGDTIVAAEIERAVFAIRHGISSRSVLLLEKHNRIPKPAYTRRQFELAYMLPKGFLKRLLEEQQCAR